MEESMRAIEASDLRKAYKGGVVALDGLSFEVEAGTISVCWARTVRGSPRR